MCAGARAAERRARAPLGRLVRCLDLGLLSPRLGEREIRCDTGAALATVIGKSGSGPWSCPPDRTDGQPLGPPGTREGGVRAVVPVSQETGQGASTIHEVLERVC
ncbi:hypothetical protein GCM10027073_35000 [Streptomyces chlorus]